MSLELNQKAAHFRGKSRPGRALQVEYRRASEGAAADPVVALATTRNLGTGGAFVLCPDPPPVGTRIALTLHLPGPRTSDQSPGRSLQVQAEVRWVVDAAQDPDGAGMGVQFLDLAVDDALALSEYFSRLTGAEPA